MKKLLGSILPIAFLSSFCPLFSQHVFASSFEVTAVLKETVLISEKEKIEKLLIGAAAIEEYNILNQQAVVKSFQMTLPYLEEADDEEDFGEEVSELVRGRIEYEIEISPKMIQIPSYKAVSYTHLTLPTNDRV